MHRYAAALGKVRTRLAQELRRLRLLETERYDPGKLLLRTDGTSISGVQLAERLRKDFAIETEFALPDRLLAMTSVCDDEQTLTRFADAVLTIDRSLQEYEPSAPLTAFSLPEQVFPAFAAREVTSGRVFLSPEEAVGKVSLEFLWAYPPGIPLLCPGERVGKSLPALLSALAAAGVSLRSSNHRFPLVEVSDGNDRSC